MTKDYKDLIEKVNKIIETMHLAERPAKEIRAMEQLRSDIIATEGFPNSAPDSQEFSGLRCG